MSDDSRVSCGKNGFRKKKDGDVRCERGAIIIVPSGSLIVTGDL